MKIAIFGKEYAEGHQQNVQQLITMLTERGASLSFYQPYFEKLKNKLSIPESRKLFTTHEELVSTSELMFSLGGDGTLLDTIPIVRGSEIPVLGINLGRLGFLSSISKDNIKETIESIFLGKYRLEKRALLLLEEPVGLFGDLNFALNEITIHRNNAKSLIQAHVFIDDNKLNTYWGDGIIVSTPTGSTAYSMSVGGPIVSPGSRNFVIAPIASHNLTVRPIVIQDSSEIKIRVEGRDDTYLLTMDSRHATVGVNDEIRIRRCDFEINLVQMENQDFYSTIRDKLMWGKDYRN